MYGAAPQKPSYNPNGDVEVCVPDNIDGISSLNFSPTSNLLLATSWSNSSFVWDINAATGQSTAKAQNKDHTQPVLCSSWNGDGSAVFTGSCDKTVRMWNLTTNQSQVVAQHDAPVRHCFFIPEMNLIATGSWDKTVKYWDLRNPTPVHTQPLSERVYAMDVRYPLMVVGTADRQLQIIDLQKPTQIFKTHTSPLKWQTRVVTCFPDKAGYLMGSIEGRVAVQHVDDKLANEKNFTFKCHREANDIYAVNAINFHPIGTFVTAGSDGAVNFWDKENKQRLKGQAKCTYTPSTNAPIPCASISKGGELYAYAVSYDWSKGHSEYNPSVMKNTILLHSIKEEDVKPKPKQATTGYGKK